MNYFNPNVNILTEPEIIKMHIDEFESSVERQEMMDGDAYYRVENTTIKNRKMYLYKEGGVREEDPTKANHRVAHGILRNLVDEKVDYLLSKVPTISHKDENRAKQVTDLLGKHFGALLAKTGREACKKGKAWIQVYINEEGKFSLMKHRSEQIVPMWEDDAHTKLQAIIRYYQQEYYEGKEKKKRIKVEYWTATEVKYYVIVDDVIMLDSEEYLNTDEGPVGHYKVGDSYYSWGRVPFVCIKNNEEELPDLHFVRDLIDEYDLSRSDISNLLEEVRNLIYVLYGYRGENKAQFVRDLAYYRAIVMDEDGKVDTLTPKIDITAAKEHFEQLKRDITEYGQSVNRDIDKMGNAPSGIALKFMFSRLDLKCNHLENEVQVAFEDLMYFVDTFLNTRGQDTPDLILNRDIQLNETEAINNINNSRDLSIYTRLEQHPWVKSVEEEIELKKREEEEFGIDEPPLVSPVGVNHTGGVE